MMLPELLCRTYATYKSDTDYVANWLATTASRCGYVFEALDRDQAQSKQFGVPISTQPVSQTGTGVPRLKGRARKLARDASAKGTPQSTEQEKSAPSKVYTIPIKSFTILASHIVAHRKLRVKVPAVMRIRIDRAIAYRKEHQTYFGGDQTTDSSSIDNGHTHFISVLERVREILGPRMTIESDLGGTSRKRDDLKLENSEASSSRNAYGYLEVEQVSETFLNHERPENLSPRKGKNREDVRYQAECLSKAEEQLYGAQDLLKSVWEIRDYLRRLWKMYRHDQIDLHAASVTTNTAIIMVRHLQENYDRCFPDHADYHSIVAMLYNGMCKLKDQDPTSQEHSDDIINMTMYDEAEQMLIPTWVILSQINKSIVPGRIWIYAGDHTDPLDATLPWCKLLPRDKIKHDQQTLYNAFTSFTAFAKLHVDRVQPISDDELLRGVREMSPNKDLPLWFVFAVQSFLDVQHHLGPEKLRAFSELQQGARWLTASIGQSISFHKNLPHPAWPAEIETSLPDMVGMLDTWTKNDMIREEVLIASGGQLPRFMQKEPFNILKQYPSLCGIWLFAFRYSAQILSILFAGRWNSVAYCAHLYNALSHEGLVGKWQDMESLLMLQGVHKIFIGERPDGMASYLKQWSLSLGCSLTTLAKGKRSDGMKISPKGARGLDNSIGMSALFTGRHIEGKHSLSMDLTSMETRIKSMYASEHLRMEYTEQVDDKYATDELERLRGTSRSKEQLSFDDFLEGLANCLYNERVHLTFDYLRFHRFCHQTLEDIRNDLVSEVEPMFPPEAFVGKDQLRLPYFVGDIFMQAAEWELALKRGSHKGSKNNTLLKQSGVVRVNRIFLEAANRMQSAIQGCRGSLICEMIRKEFDFALAWGTGAAEDTHWRSLAVTDPEVDDPKPQGQN
jgi:hypothetical protein